MIKKSTEDGLGDNIRILRIQKGLTCEQLAEAVAVSAEAIGHYEDNTWRPGGRVFQRLAAALDVTPECLVNGCSIMYDEDGTVLLVRNIGSNQIKVVGKFTDRNPSKEGC